MKDTRLFITSLFLLLSLGCAVPHPAGNNELSAFRQYHRQTAQELLARGELYAARTHLQIILVADQDNMAVQNEISLLSQLIDNKVAPQISQARQQIKKRQTKSAQKTLLRVLADDPSNAEAFNLLRQVSHTLRRHKQGEETLTRYTLLKVKPITNAKPHQLLQSAKPAARPAAIEDSPAKLASNPPVKQARIVKKDKNSINPALKQPTVDNQLTAKLAMNTDTGSNPSRQSDTSPPQYSDASKTPADNNTLSVAMLAAPQLKPDTLADGETATKTAPSAKAAAKTVETAEKPVEIEDKKEADNKTDQQATYLARFWRLYNQRAYAELIKAAEQKPTGLLLPLEFEIWLSDAHIALANIHQGKGDYPSAIAEVNKALTYPDPENRAQNTLINLKQQYAESLYRQGQKLLHSDLDQAISLWEMALSYNENMAETRHQLQRAYVIRKNLGNIQDSN